MKKKLMLLGTPSTLYIYNIHVYKWSLGTSKQAVLHVRNSLGGANTMYVCTAALRKRSRRCEILN